MLIAQIVSFLQVSDDVRRRVTLLLERIVTGADEDFTTPYTKERGPDLILEGWDAIYNSNASKVNAVLNDLEVTANRPKFGTMSKCKPWMEREESLAESYKPAKSKRGFAPYSLSRPLGLRPLSANKAVGYLKNDSNSGLPLMTKKKNVKDLLMGYTLDDLCNIVESFLNQKGLLDLTCLLFTRTQELGKTRNVWGFSFYATLLEMCFYRPILDIQAKQTWRSALGKPEAVSAAITKLIDFAILKGLTIISIDFKGFDNSCKVHLIEPAFATIMGSFQLQFHRQIDIIKRFFISCPIVTPSGIWTGEHGVPSGSTFTNEVDSVIQYGVARESDAIVAIELAQVQGDDGVYLSDNPSAAKSHFAEYNLVVSDDKSYEAVNWCIFLQSLFHDDYRDEQGIINGIYPTYRALNRIIHMEQFEDFSDYNINGSDYFSIRTISILENCKHHPLFEEFVTYVWSLDKYKLEFSAQGLANYVRKLAIQEGKDITFRNWAYGSDISGMRAFKSVQILNRLNSSV